MATFPAGTGLEGDCGVPEALTACREDGLSELGRATTAYFDATPDRMEQARQEYEEALRQFNAAPGAH